MNVGQTSLPTVGESIICLRRLHAGTPLAVRHHVVGLLDGWCQMLLSETPTDEFVYGVGLVATELVTNALRHAPGLCAIATSLRDGVFSLRVRDERQPATPLSWPKIPTGTPDFDQPSGRGLWIVASWCDGFHFEAPSSGPGKVACASWKVVQ